MTDNPVYTKIDKDCIRLIKCIFKNDNHGHFDLESEMLDITLGMMSDKGKSEFMNSFIEDDMTPLMYVFDNGWPEEAINTFIDNCTEENISKVNSTGDTILHFVCEQDYSEEIINKLIEGGVDINQVNNDGQTAIEIAFECNNLDIVELLLDNDDDTYLNEEIFKNYDSDLQTFIKDYIKEKKVKKETI